MVVFKAFAVGGVLSERAEQVFGSRLTFFRRWASFPSFEAESELALVRMTPSKSARLPVLSEGAIFWAQTLSLISGHECRVSVRCDSGADVLETSAA